MPRRPPIGRAAVPATRSSCRPTTGRRSAPSSRPIPQLAERRRPPADSPQRVVRLATREDIVARLKQQQREQEAHRIALLKIRERGLAMKLTRVEQVFDGSRLSSISRPTAASISASWCASWPREFRTRIEMRQIGVRDEAKMLGGYGICGRPLCCTTFLQIVRAGLDQDGQAAGPEPEPVEAVRPVRPAEVLPALRAAERARASMHGGCGERRRLRILQQPGLRPVRQRRLRHVRIRTAAGRAT